MNGRIGALAIRKDGTWILGGAQGGIWVLGPTASAWVAKTDICPRSRSVALAIAPTNDNIVYAGTGEGALSGDSYTGNGILKSTDGGNTWAQVSGDYFMGVSISRLVVDPTNASHLYAAVLRGRGGARRVSPPVHSRFGIWESNDGGVSWTLRREVPEQNGATDLEIDPQNPKILYASFWSDKIYRSTDGGATWAPFMTGLPDADYAAETTRFSIAISHTSPTGPVTLYAGFGYDGVEAHVYKWTTATGKWNILPDGSGADSVFDYCAEQCSYDNVIEVDPHNANIVYAGGQFNYAIGSGGIFRSDDGGETWLNLGWDQHPDFHAFAFDPNDSASILIGNDGGVWFSDDRGGRPTAASPLNRRTGSRSTAAGLSIGQFTSIATNPA